MTKQRPGKILMRKDRARGVRFIVGADEAGRGCLAGPLVAAAVRLDLKRLAGPDGAVLADLNDSKKLSPEARERLARVVVARAEAVVVRCIPAAEIDRGGVHAANLRALREAAEAALRRGDLVLVDGFDPGVRGAHSEAVIKGDANSAAIAAASVIAKATRDRLLRGIDRRLDGRWQFSVHHGYATPVHHEMIRTHGVTVHHRRSFASSAYDGIDWSKSVGDVFEPVNPTVLIKKDERDVEPVPEHASV